MTTPSAQPSLPHEVPHHHPQDDVEAGSIALAERAHSDHRAVGNGAASDGVPSSSEHTSEDAPAAIKTAEMENLEAVPLMQIVYQDLTYTIPVRHACGGASGWRVHAHCALA